MKQFVYLMKSAFGHCKVGVSIDPTKRMNAIRTGHGAEVSLIAAYGPFNAATRLESTILRALSVDRMLGEWVSCDEETAKYAAENCLAEFIDDRDQTEEERATSEQHINELAKWAAKGVCGPDAQKWIDLLEQALKQIDFYRSECKQWEENFMEANELLEFYGDHAKHLSFIAQKAMDQVKRLESQIAELKAERVAA